MKLDSLVRALGHIQRTTDAWVVRVDTPDCIFVSLFNKEHATENNGTLKIEGEIIEVASIEGAGPGDIYRQPLWIPVGKPKFTIMSFELIKVDKTDVLVTCGSRMGEFIRFIRDPKVVDKVRKVLAPRG